MASKMNKKELYEAYKKLEQSHMKIEMELNDVKSDLSACEDELKEYKELFDKVRAERDDIQDDLSDEIHTLRKELERFKDDVKDALQIDDDTPDNEVIEYIVEIESQWEPPHYVNELKETIKELTKKVNKEKAEYANKVVEYLTKKHEKELCKIRQMLS